MGLYSLLTAGTEAVAQAETVSTQISVSDIQTLIDSITAQINVEAVVSILAAVIGVAVGFAFMWWGIRKVSSMIMAAFKKGKVSV